MKKLYIFFFIFQTINFIAQNNKSIGFIENKGQIVNQNQKENKEVKYLLNTPGLNVQIREKGFSYDIYETKKVSLTKTDKEFYGINRDSQTELNNLPKHSIEYNFHRIDIDFLNANQNSKIIAEEKSSDYDNYYNVTHAPEGITEVHKYQKITYQNIYNNIDVVFFIPRDSTKVIEYNFIVRPGGKISDIKLKFKGAKTKLIDNKIRMKVKFGEMEETIPLSWIENKNEKEEIKISYKEISKNTYSFNSNSDTTNKTIVIDPTPVRLWGTYYGNGGNVSEGRDLAVDDFSNVYYCGGTTNTTNIATNGAYQSFLNGISDGFIVKFDTNGFRLWSTYYGGSERDGIYVTEIKNNYLIIAGSTQSPDNIATVGTHSNIYNPGNGSSSQKNDCFIAKFNLDGIRIWGTYFGGEATEYPLSICIDNNNNIILTGSTFSLNGISTPGSFKETRTQPVNFNTVGEGFVSKFNENGVLIWSTYYGLCEIRSVDTDSNSNIFISGDTASEASNPYIATTGTHQPNFSYSSGSYYDSFIGKFDLNGQRIWGTYYGGYQTEYNFSLKVDLEDNIYISGHTRSTELISTINSHQETFGGQADAYLAKFNQTGNLIWGTYYGGQDLEHWEKYTIDIDLNNNVFLSGSTWSTNNISTPNTYSETINGTEDCFIVKFNKYGNRIWGTYFGGSISEYCKKIALDNSGGIYIMGYAYSTNGITTPGAFQESFPISPGHFIIKFFDCQSSALATSNSPVCVNSSLQLSASGGTNYLWTGPNGFTSTEQNPIIQNATTLNSGQYSCEITGTVGCDNTVTINVIIGDNLAPIPDIQTLPNINGDCNTVITSFPTATDNCSGNITATTTDPLNYTIPGSYTITWVYNDGNGNTATQTQNIIISSVANATLNSPQEFCFQDNATLNNIAITGQNITWYDAQTNGNILPYTTALVDGTNYYATQTINGCESDRIPVTIVIHNTPAPTTTQTVQSFCSTENATLNSISINGSNIIWYDSINSTAPLSNTTLLTDGTTYYASQTLNNCESINRLAITIQLINTLNANNYSEIICDEQNNNIENVDLSVYESNLLNSIGNIYTYYNSLNGAENQLSSDLINNYSNYDLVLGNNTFYVRIESPNTCYQIVELILTLVEKPKAYITDTMPICEGSSITINAENGYDSYLWSTGETTNSISVSQPGNYNVVINQNHGSVTCSSTYTFNVVNSNLAIINSIQSEDWTDNDNYIQINVSGSGDYEYSINGIDFQESNLFGNLPNGEYTIYVRDKNGCGIVSEDIYLLMYPKFFTPNGDGFNDTWKIKFSNNEPNLAIKIFDRYGKFLKQISSLSEGWDGTYLGEPFPSNDYWFVVIRENGKEFKGHFSLKR